MNGSVPKQYLSLLDKTVIEWSLDAFLQEPRVQSIMVVLASNDTQWPALPVARHRKMRTTVGGSERAHSVLAGLRALKAVAQPNDWVLVHDAARPCFTRDDLGVLIEALKDDPLGGLLALPLADTLKQSDAEQRVLRTVPRENLWRALTPQMFRFEILHRALENALAKGVPITDEASAIEAEGHRPRLVIGRADNLKVTLPEDLHLAASILRVRP